MNKENYFIVNIKFADLELENDKLVNLNPQCIVLLNGNMDDKLTFNQNATLFVHKQDIIGIEIKIFDTQTIVIGNTDIKADSIISRNVKQFSEWYSIKCINEQKYGQIKILIQYNLQQLGSQNNSLSSPQKKQMLTDINSSTESIPLEMSFNQRETPIKKNNSQKENEDLKLSSQKQKQQKSQNEYDYIEELIKNQDIQLKKLMNHKINKNLILEYQQDLENIRHLFRDLLIHPCKYCEKLYLPKIQKKINNLQIQILKLQEQTDEFKINKLSKCECNKNRKVDILIKNYKNNQDQMQPIKENLEHITQLQYENQQLRDELNKQKQLLDEHIKEKEELEKTNKKQKFRIFVLETDLKTFFRKTEISKAKPEFRTSFKLKEFRAIYDLFVELKEERNELALHMNGINDLENKKFQFKKDTEITFSDEEQNSQINEFKQFENLMKQKKEQMNKIINDQQII